MQRRKGDQSRGDERGVERRKEGKKEGMEGVYRSARVPEVAEARVVSQAPGGDGAVSGTADDVGNALYRPDRPYTM